MSAVRDNSDTYDLTTACRIFGVSRKFAMNRFKAGLPLYEGDTHVVRVLKFGGPSRPVYRVSKLAVQAALAPEVAS